MKTSSRLLKPDSCKTHKHKIECLTPDACRKQTPPNLTIGAKVRTQISNFLPASHESHTCPINCDGHRGGGGGATFKANILRDVQRPVLEQWNSNTEAAFDVYGKATTVGCDTIFAYYGTLQFSFKND
jgi:hypothetical protein